MNKSALKKYAPQARLDFIVAVTRRAELLGLNPKSPAKIEKQGEALLINGKAFPAAYAQMRNTLEARIREQGFAQVMETMAYTWFNRLVAVRYMELHGFLDHGYRVLSHPANTATGHTQPEILDHIADLELPGLDKSVALELKLAGNKDEELYREVLLAQCHALHKAMPFLFESLDDATELLLPDGLLRTDSILGKLVTAIDEADWQDVEIIGWLYQFYISEKKDQVIGKVVKSEDIPAATQLFTPNWIVKYLVQNSLGRLWLMANPASSLASKWEYYIKPAEQTEEVNAQLDALIQARIDEDGATLNPESLTLLDPACGSGHILVEAYDLLRDIYLERGYRRQEIPRLILEKNLFGLDIDDRAAQLAGFALLMKARADDRRLFGQSVALNVLALQEAKSDGAEQLHSALNAPQINYATVRQLVETFEQAKTFGSLIQISDELASALPDLRRELEAVHDGGDLYGRDAAETLLRLLTQADVLAKQFDAVVANPPYMGSAFYCASLKSLVETNYPAGKADLYGSFLLRNVDFAKVAGQVAMITIPNWMFISAFEKLREAISTAAPISTLVHNGRGVWGSDFGSCAFVLQKYVSRDAVGQFLRLFDRQGSVLGNDELEQRFHTMRRFRRRNSDFSRIPGAPIIYWASDKIYEAFGYTGGFAPVGEIGTPRKGMATGDNERFVRYWHEISISTSTLMGTSTSKWVPYNNGGEFRKWYGNIDRVIDWDNDGYAIRNFKDSKGRLRSRPQGLDQKFREMISWTSLSSTSLGVRYYPKGFISDQNGNFLVSEDAQHLHFALAFLCSSIAGTIVKMLNPTMHILVGNIRDLPIPLVDSAIRQVADDSKACVSLGKLDWDSFERSWDFKALPLLNKAASSDGRLESSYSMVIEENREMINDAKSLEQKIDSFFLEQFGLEDEYSPDVPIEKITLTANPSYRYGNNLSEEERQLRFLRDSMIELASYAIGCMMGRYSLDAPGLIYAQAGNEGFDPSRYVTFPADDDGIVPITDEAWFDDDGANRIREFVRVVWGEETEAENMAWLAESLGQKASESADDTIRRYLSRDFYKDHLQTYKKRPIYWLFSSGKHKAFEALVYLHRYNAGTLSRMRMEYVVPLQSRMQARIDNLDQDIQSSTSSAEQKRFQKQKDKLIKQLDELRRFDENLRHYADQRITLDLDDGVKVNYGKFGDLLAEVKAVTGRAPSKNDRATGG